MKKFLILFVAILFSTVTWSQKKEKLKASKIVTITQKEIGNFDSLELEDAIDVFIVKGDQSSLEIEADDNTHESFDIKLNGTTLRIGLIHSISGAKKTSIRITYTDDFKMLVAKGDANVTALADVKLSQVTFKCYDDSRLFLNADCANFTLIANDKSKIELNLKSDDVVFELSKNTNVKALVRSSNFKCDMYQKASANIEGDVNDLKLRMDNTSNFTGKNLIAQTASVITEGSSKSSVQVASKLVLESSGKSETNLYGNATIEIKRFADESSLNKKPLK
ncbi:GIN domain-containing protein [Flavobacterium lacus]|jgi:hypothetical protein|uniref:Putative autotransporter adhesin-like protein n=1 Tax=Flavobacterium lacus TaxID=1353778 RepID=A0A328WU06_9FLAO|nr:DUF2807 domain-containing protein [Flavobacterium lacus]RAR46858.1 putative autotransporter adhesin-like protein [Flavobacterium lacus]